MSTPAAPVTHPFDMLDRETQMGAGPALAQFLQMGPQQAVPWMGRAIGAMRNPSCIPSADTQRVITFLNKWAAPHINVRNVREWRAKKPAVANMEFGISLAGKVCVAAACALGVVSLGLQTSYFHRALVVATRVAAVIFAAMALALRRVNIPLREEASKVCMVATCAIGLFSLGLQKASCLRVLVTVTRI